MAGALCPVWACLSHHTLWGLLEPRTDVQGARAVAGRCSPNAFRAWVPGSFEHVLSVSSPQIQTALRHKSEIEHHRNKIRLRAKRRGHYEFPVLDELSSGDTRERHRVYRRAQMQIDKILDPTASVPSVFIEPRKRWARASCRAGRDGRARSVLRVKALKTTPRG